MLKPKDKDGMCFVRNRLNGENGSLEILSTDDEKIKQFGELISNDTSRHILNLIYEQEMTALEISSKTGFSLELVRYHIQKMVEIGIAQVSKIEKSSKEQDMKYYRVTKVVVVILPHQIPEKMKNDKTIMKFINRVYRSALIGVTATVTWLITQNLQLKQMNIPNSDNGYSDYGPDSTILGVQGDIWFSIIATISVIFCTLLIINYKKLSQFFKKTHT